MTAVTYNRIDLAAEQLDSALILFLEKRSYVSALTRGPLSVHSEPE
jgi:hypothetical protein